MRRWPTWAAIGVGKVPWWRRWLLEKYSAVKPEIKIPLANVIKRHRESRNYTQERLAGAAEIDVRTVQRAEAGLGTSKENLSAIADALGVAESALVAEAEKSSDGAPAFRVVLKEICKGDALLSLLKRTVEKRNSLEIGPPEEHRFNVLIGEGIVELLDEIEQAGRSSVADQRILEGANGIIKKCDSLGFRLFSGQYRESISKEKSARVRTTVLMIAAAKSDPRIRKGRKGLELDVVRDSRRLMRGRLGQTNSLYDWMEDQLIGKSQGEKAVKEVLRQMVRKGML